MNIKRSSHEQHEQPHTVRFIQEGIIYGLLSLSIAQQLHQLIVGNRAQDLQPRVKTSTRPTERDPRT